MNKIDGMKNMDSGMMGNLKLDSLKDIKDFLKHFSSISEAKFAIAAIIEEIREINPALAAKLEKLLMMLDKAEKSGMTLDDFVEKLDKIFNNSAAIAQGVSIMQQAQAVFNDNAASADASKVNKLNNIA